MPVNDLVNDQQELGNLKAGPIGAKIEKIEMTGVQFATLVLTFPGSF